MENLINVVSVVGPTASGKTKLSIELAKIFNGEIISADSMQIYKDMQIATAKPNEAEKCGIKHHMMDFLAPDKSYSVAEYVKDASACIKDISSRGKLPIIAGGTGLYVDSLLNNITFTEQARDPKLCEELTEFYTENGIDKLIDMLSEFDPESAKNLSEQKNVKRIIRAIEIYKTTGVTITEQNKKSKETNSPYNAVKIGINFHDRQKLYDRINQRVDLMLSSGLIDEAQNVLSKTLSFTSVKAIGYKELIPYLEKEKSLDDCVEKLKMETRRYAKRQITWFKRDEKINWIYSDECKDFNEMLEKAVVTVKRGLQING